MPFAGDKGAHNSPHPRLNTQPSGHSCCLSSLLFGFFRVGEILPFPQWRCLTRRPIWRGETWPSAYGTRLSSNQFGQGTKVRSSSTWRDAVPHSSAWRVVPYTLVVKRTSLLSADCLLSACSLPTKYRVYRRMR